MKSCLFFICSQEVEKGECWCLVYFLYVQDVILWNDYIYIFRVNFFILIYLIYIFYCRYLQWFFFQVMLDLIILVILIIIMIIGNIMFKIRFREVILF